MLGSMITFHIIMISSSLIPTVKLIVMTCFSGLQSRLANYWWLNALKIKKSYTEMLSTSLPPSPFPSPSLFVSHTHHTHTHLEIQHTSHLLIIQSLASGGYGRVRAHVLLVRTAACSCSLLHDEDQGVQVLLSCLWKQWPKNLSNNNLQWLLISLKVYTPKNSPNTFYSTSETWCFMSLKLMF